MITAKSLLVYFLQLIGLQGIFGTDIDVSKFDQAEVYCMAKNIYYEAKGEDIQGQFAVAHVTLNRTRDQRFPDTICEVVKQSAVSRATNRVVCAFSWWCERDKKEVHILNKDGTINQQALEQFQVAVMVAVAAMSGTVNDNTKGATHFHNPHISQPAWRNEMRLTLRWGNHDFYRMPGAAQPR